MPLITTRPHSSITAEVVGSTLHGKIGNKNQFMALFSHVTYDYQGLKLVLISHQLLQNIPPIIMKHIELYIGLQVPQTPSTLKKSLHVA